MEAFCHQPVFCMAALMTGPPALLRPEGVSTETWLLVVMAAQAFSGAQRPREFPSAHLDLVRAGSAGW